MITADQVKELRDRTGSGMMECKRALEAAGGNMELAIEELRKSGRAKADKKADRIAAEGMIVVRVSADGKQAVMLEINSETDFVARDTHFTAFVDQVAKTALERDVSDVNDLPVTIGEARQALVAKVGENIHIRRLVRIQSTTGSIGTYLHGHRIGVLVELDSNHPELARDIAMHIAASKPFVISPEEVSTKLIEKEKTIFLAQAAASGKPPEIIEKMVDGRVKKFLDEISLLGQPFVKDPAMSISALLKKHAAKVFAFYRFEVGEGIEKQTENFVETVMAQAQGR